MKDCTTCKYGYEDEQLGIPMCHHPKRFSEDCVDFNMHEEKEIKESEKPFKEPIDGVLYAAACGIKNKGQTEESEKPVPKDLEEAAEKYSDENEYMKIDFSDKTIYIGHKTEEAFIAGAKWQAEQDKKTIELAEDHAYLAGSLNEREKLMEEALEGVVCGDNAKLWVCNNPPSFILDKFKDGDKVKLIFIKEN